MRIKRMCGSITSFEPMPGGCPPFRGPLDFGSAKWISMDHNGLRNDRACNRLLLWSWSKSRFWFFLKKTIYFTFSEDTSGWLVGGRNYFRDAAWACFHKFVHSTTTIPPEKDKFMTLYAIFYFWGPGSLWNLRLPKISKKSPNLPPMRRSGPQNAIGSP